jgi:hypothetical protein
MVPAGTNSVVDLGINNMKILSTRVFSVQLTATLILCSLCVSENYDNYCLLHPNDWSAEAGGAHSAPTTMVISFTLHAQHHRHYQFWPHIHQHHQFGPYISTNQSGLSRQVTGGAF